MSRFEVAGICSDTFSTHGLPADKTPVAGWRLSVRGPLKGPITRAGPNGSRITLVACPEAARNLGTGVLKGFIQSLSCNLVNSIGPSGAWTSQTYSEDAVLKSFCRAS